MNISTCRCTHMNLSFSRHATKVAVNIKEHVSNLTHLASEKCFDSPFLSSTLQRNSVFVGKPWNETNAEVSIAI